jgi:hypothetical protein
MNAEILLYHCDEIGIALALGASSELSMDAPRGTLTPELTELLREHKSELIELVYAREEAQAIEEEGRLSNIGRAFLEAQTPRVTVAFGVDGALADVAKVHPGVLVLAKACGSGLEIISVRREAQEVAV